MTHVLVFHDNPQGCAFLTVVLEAEGFVVTSAGTIDDALMVLRASLHPLVALVECSYSARHTFTSFFETIRDHPDWYGQHRYIALMWSPSSDEEEVLLHALNVSRLPHPFPIEALVAVIADAAAFLP